MRSPVRQHAFCIKGIVSDPGKIDIDDTPIIFMQGHDYPIVESTVYEVTLLDESGQEATTSTEIFQQHFTEKFVEIE